MRARTSRGIRKTWTGGTIPYTNSASSTTTNATQKSISAGHTAARGMITRGKYTFEISLSLATVLSDDCDIAPAKNSQSTIPETRERRVREHRARTARFARWPKNTLNTTASSSGCSTAQKMPITDCL